MEEAVFESTEQTDEEKPSIAKLNGRWPCSTCAEGRPADRGLQTPTRRSRGHSVASPRVRDPRRVGAPRAGAGSVGQHERHTGAVNGACEPQRRPRDRPVRIDRYADYHATPRRAASDQATSVTAGSASAGIGHRNLSGRDPCCVMRTARPRTEASRCRRQPEKLEY